MPWISHNEWVQFSSASTEHFCTVFHLDQCHMPKTKGGNKSSSVYWECCIEKIYVCISLSVHIVIVLWEWFVLFWCLDKKLLRHALGSDRHESGIYNGWITTDALLPSINPGWNCFICFLPSGQFLLAFFFSPTSFSC